MKDIAAILASADINTEKQKKTKNRVPLKISAFPNDVIVYYDDIAVVYHAEGEGNVRYNVSECVFNLNTGVPDTMPTDPEFMEPEAPEETLLRPASDPYYKELSS